MSLRDVGVRGWLLVVATLATAAVFLAGVVTGFFLQPSFLAVMVGFGMGIPILLLFTIWYLFEVAWPRGIRKGQRKESREIAGMATAEALLRLMDRAEVLLDRLTKYTGWFFFWILLAIFVVPFFFSLNLMAWFGGGFIVATVLQVALLAFWVAYFYYYYKIKHENDIWKERIARLRTQQETLLER